MREEAVIKLENVWKSYKTGFLETKALAGINLEILRGSFVSIIGPSGSGKSTLLNIMGLLDLPDKGRVFIDNKDVSLFSLNKLAEIRGKKIGFVFQQFNLIEHLNALENVSLPMIFQGIEEREAKKRARSLLEAVNLKDKDLRKPSQLSGGEQQRVAIARALANNPEIILADEPTGNLDSKTGKMVMEVFKNLYQREKKTIIIVTHDPYIASYSRQKIFLKDGKIISDHLSQEKVLWKI
jgi:putative ABC transport system ATP-binding protein